MSDYKIFILSFGRDKVPTLKFIKNKQDVIILTSTDNAHKDTIKTDGAKLVVFDKTVYVGKVEMMNKETVPHIKHAAYAYNYAQDYCREHGIKYCIIFDDDYRNVESINNRNEHRNCCLDLWAKHAVSFMRKYPFIAMGSALNNGNLMCNSKNTYYRCLEKKIMMNTCIFNVEYRHYFESIGNGDYVNSFTHHLLGDGMCICLGTVRCTMETQDDKRHTSIKYDNFLYARYSAYMASPCFARLGVQKGNTILARRFNTMVRHTTNANPKIVNLI